jgi:[ribosomal protein S18]-alanine N-acetyltransferase
MNSGLVIRRMLAKDIDAVLEVERQSFTTPWSRSAFEAEIDENDLACYLVVIRGDQLIGYGGMWIILDEAHVTNIAILPNYRGHGFGRKLLTELVACAWERGARRMTLEVRASNERAQYLYTEMGFVRCGVRKGYYSDTREDALIMWREGLSPQQAEPDKKKAGDPAGG